MVRLNLATVAVLTALVSVPARADWQYTKWGMTQDQVRAEVSKAGGQVDASTANLSEDKKVRWAFRAGYKAVGVEFKANFGFDAETGHLVAVTLSPVNYGECANLKDSLLEKYGKVDTESSSKDRIGQQYRARWKDRDAGNEVKYSFAVIMGQTMCFVDYTPLGSAAKSGL